MVTNSITEKALGNTENFTTGKVVSLFLLNSSMKEKPQYPKKILQMQDSLQRKSKNNVLLRFH
jgi:hypothetical protein